MGSKTNYSRTELIAICEQAIVDQTHWTDRDSAHSMIGVGTAWALLSAGCEFRVLTKGNLKTDQNTIWIEITYQGFQYFEMHELSFDHFYLPTPKRLAERAGKDWY